MADTRLGMKIHEAEKMAKGLVIPGSRQDSNILQISCHNENIYNAIFDFLKIRQLNKVTVKMKCTFCVLIVEIHIRTVTSYTINHLIFCSTWDIPHTLVMRQCLEHYCAWDIHRQLRSLQANVTYAIPGISCSIWVIMCEKETMF